MEGPFHLPRKGDCVSLLDASDRHPSFFSGWASKKNFGQRAQTKKPSEKKSNVQATKSILKNLNAESGLRVKFSGPKALASWLDVMKEKNTGFRILTLGSCFCRLQLKKPFLITQSHLSKRLRNRQLDPSNKLEMLKKIICKLMAGR